MSHHALLDTVAKDLKRVSVFAYHITEDGGIVPASPWVPDTVDQEMAEPGGPKIYVTVNNRVIEAAGVRRVDFWNINTGDPALWDYIAARTAEAAK